MTRVSEVDCRFKFKILLLYSECNALPRCSQMQTSLHKFSFGEDLVFNLQTS